MCSAVFTVLFQGCIYCICIFLIFPLHCIGCSDHLLCRARHLSSLLFVLFVLVSVTSVSRPSETMSAGFRTGRTPESAPILDVHTALRLSRYLGPFIVLIEHCTCICGDTGTWVLRSDVIFISIRRSSLLLISAHVVLGREKLMPVLIQSTGPTHQDRPSDDT